MLQRTNTLLIALVSLMLAFQVQTIHARSLFDKITKGAPKRVELTESSDKVANFKEAFKPEGMLAKTPAQVATESKKVVIAGFQLEFSTEQKAVSENAGAGAGIGSSTEKVYTMKGVTDTQFQVITDKAYTVFVEDLQKKGYEVLPPSVLLESGYKEKFSKVNQPPVHHERGVATEVLFGSLAKIGEDKDENGQEDNASVIATAKDTSPEVYSKFMAAFGPGLKTADMLQASIIQLRMKVNFAKFDDTGALLYDSFDDKPQNGIGIRGTGMQVFSPSGKVAMYPLAKTVILPNRVADKATPVSASAGQTTARASSGAFRALAALATGDVAGVVGGTVGAAHSTMGSDNFELTAGSDYEVVVTKDLGLFLNMMTEAFPK